MDKQQEWDRRVRDFAADKLLELANQWARDEAQEGEEPEELTREDFMGRMEPESLQVWSDGRFEFWFHDGTDLFGSTPPRGGHLVGWPLPGRPHGGLTPRSPAPRRPLYFFLPF